MRVAHLMLSILPLTLFRTSTLATQTPDECIFYHNRLPTLSDEEACKLAEKRLTGHAKASVAHLEPLIGKRLLIPPTEPPEHPLLDWRALMPSLQWWTGLAPAKRDNLTSENFPEDLEWRHCCYPPGEEGSCIFTADYVTWRLNLHCNYNQVISRVDWG